jgi:outer membrane protein assembly factor BamB
MATLEIHESAGAVRYQTINRDQPVVFGSDPKADVVLTGAGVQPYHGRIRWSKGKYKVEPLPGVDSLQVNGEKVVSATLRQGGEIAVGDARIFLVTPDDGPIDFEKTQVRQMPDPAPIVPVAPSARPIDARSEVAPPSVERDFGEVREVLKRQRPWQTANPRAATEPRPAKPAKEARPRQSPWARLKQLVLPEQQAPGEEKIAGSPLVIGLILAFAILVAVGYGLSQVISRMKTERRYSLAIEDYDGGKYREAIDRFAQFVEYSPDDPRVSKAKVFAALASVQQYTTGSPAWSNGLKAASEALETVGEEPAFEDARADLAEIVYDIAVGLADRAKSEADAVVLAEAEQAVDLHDRVGGKPAAEVRERAGFPARLETSRAAVTKARVRRDALAEMDAALKSSDPSATYSARDGLVLSYPDLANDPAVLERLRAANQLIKAQVKIEGDKIAGVSSAREEVLGPPLSLVYRSTDAAPTDAQTPVFALAEGIAYALDGANGAPIWQRSLGLDAPYAPRPIAGAGRGLLAVDARSNELLRFSAQDGRLAWRQSLGEPVDSPPLVLGNQLFQTIPSGKLFVIDLDSGSILTKVELGRPLTRAPVADELGQTIYVLGREDVVFVLKRDPMECLEVEYLGHDPGAVPCSPARLGNYFVLSENYALDRSRWSIFVLEKDGRAFRLVQRQEFQGWSWETPAAMGPVIWSATDRGGAQAFAIGAYEDPKPFKPIAQQTVEGTVLGPTYPRVRTERELWIASGRSSRLDLDAEAGSVTTKWTLAQAGAAVGPIQQAGKLIVLSQQAPESSGVMLWGVDPATGDVAWRTLLGAPWTVHPEPTLDGSGLATLDASGGRLLLSVDELTKGGFVTQPLPAPGQSRLPTGRIGWIESPQWTMILPRRNEGRVWVRQGDSAEIQKIDLPSPPATPLSRWGDGILVAATDGRAYLLDPITGAPTAEPFLPVFDRARPIRWQSPAVIDQEAVILSDAEGRLRRLAVHEGPPRRLIIEAEIDLESTLSGHPVAIGTTVLLKVSDRKLRAFAARDLSPAGAWELDSPIIWGPEAVANHAFVGDASGKLHAFSDDARKVWSIPLPEGASLSGTPVVLENQAWLTTTSGHLLRIDLDSGAIGANLSMDTIPIQGPMVIGTAAAIGTAPGTLQMAPSP